MVTSVKFARFQRNVFMSVLSLSSFKSNPIYNFSHVFMVFTSLRRYDNLIALKYLKCECAE